MGNTAEQIGMQLAGNAGNAILGGALGNLSTNNAMQNDQNFATFLGDLNVKNSKELTDYNLQKQLELWRNTNYSASVEEMKKAGLNIGMMYKQGGMGGSTNLATGSSNTGGYKSHGGGQMEGMAMMLNNSRSVAELKLMEAQAEKTKAEANKIKGIDTKEAETRVESLIKEMLKKDSEIGINEVQKRLLENNEIVSDNTIKDTIDKIKAESNTSQMNSQIATASRDEQIKSYELQNKLTELQIGKTEEETKKIANDIIIAWKNLENNVRGLNQRDRELEIKEFEAELKSEFHGINDVAGTALLQLLNRNSNMNKKYFRTIK